MHSQLSEKQMSTAHKVYPLIIQLTTKWEEYIDESQFSPVKEALGANFANAKKCYWTVKDTMMYFIMHGMLEYF